MESSARDDQVRTALSASGRQTAAEKLRELIAQHRKSIAITSVGLGPVLAVLDAYVLATEVRIAALERRVLSMEKDLNE